MCFSDPEADTRDPDGSHALRAVRQRQRYQQHECVAGAQPEHVPVPDRGRYHGRVVGTGGRQEHVHAVAGGRDATDGGRRGAGVPREFFFRRTASSPQPPYPARRRRKPAQDQLDGRTVDRRETGQGLPVAAAKAATATGGSVAR